MGEKVACIIVNYRSPFEMLERCLESVVHNCREGDRITLVDNGSQDGVASQIKSVFHQVEVQEMDKNAGFAAAVNTGIKKTAEPFVLLLNPDATLEHGALERMRDALEQSGEDVAGVAPKMMSSTHAGVIDAIGTVMPPSGASFNRGIGQCDLGQYDRSEEVFGACFGAALLRRSLFGPSAVGPLYENYFLYFEDSDWCMRAHSQGYKFLTVPESVVQHFHSGVTRNESLSFKYRLIELNTLRIVVRNFEDPLRALKIIASRCARLIARTIIRRRFIAANLSTLWTFLVELRRLLGERKALKQARIVSDQKIFDMAKGEDAYFDTVAYEPHHCLDSLIDTYLRLLSSKKNPAYGKVLAVLYRLRQIAAAGGAPAPSPGEAELLESQPQCVRELLKSAGVSTRA